MLKKKNVKCIPTKCKPTLLAYETKNVATIPERLQTVNARGMIQCAESDCIQFVSKVNMSHQTERRILKH